MKNNFEVHSQANKGEMIGDVFKKNYRWFLLFAVVIALGGSFFIFIQPKINHLRQSSTELNRLKAINTSLKRELSQFDDLISTKNSSTSIDVEKINKILPDSIDRNELLVEYYDFIKKNNFLISSLSVADGPADSLRVGLPPGIGALKIDLAVNATNYGIFKKLLAVIENNLRLSDIVNINFSPDGETTSVTILVYYVKK